MTKPIKRRILLQDLSRDHHQGLLLCWKIRTGLKKEIKPSRIILYVRWFWEAHLLDHFRIEEEKVFPILGMDHQLVKQALSEHLMIKNLIVGEDDLIKRLNSLADGIEKHIRFEERVFFNEIQKVATDEQLRQIKAAHSVDKFIDNLKDAFWDK